jgi:hypothetical protein
VVTFGAILLFLAGYNSHLFIHSKDPVVRWLGLAAMLFCLIVGAMQLRLFP